MNAHAHRKEIARLIKENSETRHPFDTFGDWIELSAIAVSNSVDKPQFEKREARYMDIAGRYSKEEMNRFAKMYGHLILALEDDPHDALGMIFHEHELADSHKGQFFTPYDVCKMMAQLQFSGDSITEALGRKGFITVSEPACGAGAMMIAMAWRLSQLDLNPQTQMHAVCVDVDTRAVHMCYLQLSLLGIPAVVIHGNTLSMQEHAHWYTPTHIAGGWSRKLAQNEIPSQFDQADIAQDEAVQEIKIVQSQRTAQEAQLYLF